MRPTRALSIAALLAGSGLGSGCESGRLPLDLDAGPDAAPLVVCGTPPAVDSTWFGGSMLSCGTGAFGDYCGATAGTTGPCWCELAWLADEHTGLRCGAAVINRDAADREHTYLAWCDPRSGTCRCSIDGAECFCRARPPRPCSSLCGADSRGCGCGDWADGTPGQSICSDSCAGGGVPSECCGDPETTSSCDCWTERPDVCERSLNCCWTGGLAL